MKVKLLLFSYYNVEKNIQNLINSNVQIYNEIIEKFSFKFSK